MPSLRPSLEELYKLSAAGVHDSGAQAQRETYPVWHTALGSERSEDGPSLPPTFQHYVHLCPEMVEGMECVMVFIHPRRAHAL